IEQPDPPRTGPRRIDSDRFAVRRRTRIVGILDDAHFAAGVDVDRPDIARALASVSVKTEDVGRLEMTLRLSRANEQDARVAEERRLQLVVVSGSELTLLA